MIQEIQRIIEVMETTTMGMIRTEVGNLFRTYLIMSLAGSAVALLLFLLKPLVRNRLPKAVQYYSWLVVLVAYLVPFSLFISLPPNSGITPIISDIVNENVLTGDEWQDREMVRRTGHSAFLTIEEWHQLSDIDKDKIISVDMDTFSKRFWLNFFMEHFATYGLFIVLFAQTSENGVFLKKLKKRNGTPAEGEILLLNELCQSHRPPKLFRNSLAVTPMLVGLFRPMIILPDCEYTDVQLRIILQHELTHWRRKDVLVKRFSIFVWTVHFFNPIMWLVRREIDRACELACDEAVIRNLDEEGKQNYGDTLINFAADVKKPRAVFATTMCEAKKSLKVRLGAIMKSKKYSRMAVVLSAVLIIVVCGAAVVLGAGRGTVQNGSEIENIIP